VTLVRKIALLALPAAALAAAGACTSSSVPSGSGGAPAVRTAPPDPTLPQPTPTPVPMSRTNPNVVEETETYYIERLPKAEYVKVDERHIKHPIMAGLVEIYREDESYYYVYNKKFVAELDAKPARSGVSAGPGRPATSEPAADAPPAEDFEDITPAPVAGRLRLQRVAKTGLPDGGLWRANFTLADANGDGKLDIVSPPARIGPEPILHIWLGDGKGGFERWKLTFVSEEGGPADAGVDYGGVAAGDIDGDGKLDVVTASHGGGLLSFFGDGRGTFRVVRRGLPSRDFSAQAIALLDADGDGRLDIAASRDSAEQKEGAQVDMRQVRLYLWKGKDGWVFQPEALTGGFYSNSLLAWDHDKDGREDLLTGSHYTGALTLVWKNDGGAFSRVSFPGIEIYAYHFATAPGTFGAARNPAFADNYYMYDPAPVPPRKATGITVYEKKAEGWVRHRVWRKKDGGSSQYALAFGDVDGDGLDDIVFPDSDLDRLRVFFQEKDGSFREMAASEEPTLASPGQCVRLGDVNGDGRVDIVLSRTVTSVEPDLVGGWDVFLNSPANR
jgi:hypothetical protein